jgi:hypothetical protein
MLIFGTKNKTKVIDGGRAERRRCDECERVTTFRECDVTDAFSLFFVELGKSTRRRLVCTECGEDLALASSPMKAESTARSTRPVPSAQQKRPISEHEKERLLAELKKKMNKS